MAVKGRLYYNSDRVNNTTSGAGRRVGTSSTVLVGGGESERRARGETGEAGQAGLGFTSLNDWGRRGVGPLLLSGARPRGSVPSTVRAQDKGAGWGSGLWSGWSA